MNLFFISNNYFRRKSVNESGYYPVAKRMALTTLMVSLFLLVISIMIWINRKSMKQKKILARIPGPKPYPLIGNALDFKSTADIIKVYIKYMKSYGDIVLASIGTTLKLLISDHEVLEALLTSTTNIEKLSDYYYLENWLGQGLITSKPTRWRKHRKILTPAFHFQILDKFVTSFERPTTIFIKKLRKYKDNKSLDIYPPMDLCTLDIVCDTVMGTTIDAQENENSDYVSAVKTMGRIICERVTSPMKQVDFLFRLTKDYQKQKAALKTLHDHTDFVIQQRRNEIFRMQQKSNNIESKSSGKSKMNFLDMILHLEVDGEPLSDEVIREEVDTIMLAGHDTTASAMSFTLYCLANHPEVQKRAVEEQIQLFGNQKNPEIQHKDLQNMTYLQMVIKESLRLYPTVPSFGRILTENFQVGGQVYPKGVDCFINVFGIHRNPKYFKDPETFNPMRFADDNTQFRFAYIPFSAGPRNCIGQRFAMLEMKYVVSSVLRHFILEPATPKEEPILCHDIVLKSKNGIKISIRERNSNLEVPSSF
ncbi:hypothetical protein HHI36_021876 [Cryptolaemus montrouzieri]|uniref:Cytochrome P450 n=1 Tax=Cryptolaemus montrouzieri TaxID=559131 RepID=A0ABD2MYF2_9CUCU